MPTVTAYKRPPLVDLAYTPLSDSAVHTDGLQQTLTQRALSLLKPEKASVLDSALATKLGGYTQAPASPDLSRAAQNMLADPASFAETMLAADLLCTMNRDKNGMLQVLNTLRAFADQVHNVKEADLLAAGADLLRMTLDLYRRSGQAFLLNFVETLRSRLPDVSGFLHSFPFQRAYSAPDKKPATQDEAAYFDRMEQMATGSVTADLLAVSSLISQFSGSGRDSAAAKTGLSSLERFHGMPSGVFSADPFLAGRDPARAAELPAVCAQAEAYLDALCATGELVFAEKLEMLLVNVLPDLLTENGLRTLSPSNRLFDDESCDMPEPSGEDITALLRALYAVRRSVWMAKDDETLMYMMPVSGGCLTRLTGVPVRFTAEVSGASHKTVTIRTECRQPVHCTLVVRIPAYVSGPKASVNGARPQATPVGELYAFGRTFQNGDVITLSWDELPRLVHGARGSVSIFCGAGLMALSMPVRTSDWRYAILPEQSLSHAEEGDTPYALVTACEAPDWRERDGFILPPPQNTKPGPAYELTLIPFAGTRGRISVFPAVTSND